MKPWNVIKIRDYRARPPKRDECEHGPPYVLDTMSGTVECQKCGATVSAFHALKEITHVLGREHDARVSAARQIREIRRRTSWLRAVKNLDGIWRRKMLPCCPHCKRGIEASAMEHCSAVSSRYEREYLRTADRVSGQDSVNVVDESGKS